MNLNKIAKSSLAALFACTLTFAVIGCEPAPAPPAAETPAETPEGGSEAPAAPEAPEAPATPE